MAVSFLLLLRISSLLDPLNKGLKALRDICGKGGAECMQMILAVFLACIELLYHIIYTQ